MQYSFRCILDVESDVIRDILINAEATLFDFHLAVSKAFGFSNQEMAAFYRTDTDWEQGEEIPLISMSASNDALEMKDYKLSEIFAKVDDHLLYVYDFLVLWTFFIELRHVDTSKSPQNPKHIYSVGSVPDKAPEKHFTGNLILNDFDEEFGDKFDEEFDEDSDMDPIGGDFY